MAIICRDTFGLSDTPFKVLPAASQTPPYTVYTDKKENQIFLIYKEIQSGAVAKSYSHI
jgi:hypothetical protein